MFEDDEDEEVKIVHTMRNDGRHDSSIECACKPTITKRCAELCDGGCWACTKGWVEITVSEAKAGREHLHVIHNDL